MVRVLGIGDNVCDKYINSGYMYPGGQALNFAVYAKQLGADAAYMGVFGTDDVAAHVIATLDELGIDRSHCRQYEGENGYAVVNIVDGERIFIASNKGGVLKEHPIILTENDKEYIKTFDLVHTSNNSYFDDQLPIISQLGILVSYDFSGQWKELAKVRAVCKYIDYGFMSCGSLPDKEVRKACIQLYKEGCKIVIATCGSKGSVLYDGKDFFVQPPKLVEAIDTLGAGDSFAAAFLVSFVEAQKLEPLRIKTDEEYYKNAIKKALETAASFAAKTCLVHGAFGMGKKFKV
ncbi:fructoselysine 6-kinase [Tepidanaerobacter syntrophicus]|uniref:fructoselysine 6-kinase n=1 Tax=Tepidanaerobacter syntrophicus TaxID=224999 RepID=UPI0022EFB50A|nr:fructoselysine 6-kinase [Tepidanaerobacter syntrophicus]GLI19013.1 fructoselysine 6-kinase [Tepidanaerobacter syntrophicus]